MNIEISHVSKMYAGKTALQDISLTVNARLLIFAAAAISAMPAQASSYGR